jgi:hypothetical protein
MMAVGVVFHAITLCVRPPSPQWTVQALPPPQTSEPPSAYGPMARAGP